MKKSLLKITALSMLSSSIIASFSASATIVDFNTSHGVVKVNLYDETTPTTVANFLTYVNDGSYNDTIFHRNAQKTVTVDGTSQLANFIIQGGSYYFDPTDLFKFKAANPAIRNEPIYSNVSGTIAMAKTSNPNSATRQWFFNLNDNSESLDVLANSGGFTVFGQVIEGFDNLEAMAEVNRCFYNNAQEMPFIVADGKVCSNYALSPAVDTEQILMTADNFITVNSITIADATVNTVGSLTQPLNELIDSDNDGELNINDDDDDGDDVLDVNDLYPFDPLESADTDNDGVPDNTDVFPEDATETVDFDGDGTGDNADLDDDEDGEPDLTDAFPFNSSETTDTDGDGTGDNADEYPNDPTEVRDLDKDGVGDNADACPADSSETLDTDDDGYCDGKDVFPDDPEEYLDSDLDGMGDNADLDDDNDGVNDVDDYSPLDPDVTERPVYGSSGGSFGWLSLLSIALVGRLKRK